MLAERTRVALSLTLALGAVATTALMFDRHEVRTVAPVAGFGLAPTACPAHVRTTMRLGDDVPMICGRGTFAERGTFAIAFYKTTEWWERLAVVADDGHLIVPLTDRPSLPHWQSGDTISFELADIDGDGIDEAVGWYAGSYRRSEHISVAREFVFSLGAPESPGEVRRSSCALDFRNCNARGIGGYTYSDRGGYFVRD